MIHHSHCETHRPTHAHTDTRHETVQNHTVDWSDARGAHISRSSNIEHDFGVGLVTLGSTQAAAEAAQLRPRDVRRVDDATRPLYTRHTLTNTCAVCVCVCFGSLTKSIHHSTTQHAHRILAGRVYVPDPSFSFRRRVARRRGAPATPEPPDPSRALAAVCAAVSPAALCSQPRRRSLSVPMAQMV